MSDTPDRDNPKQEPPRPMKLNDDGMNPPPARNEAADSGDSMREAMERLNDNNRILAESRMTDRSKSLTEEQVEAIKKAFLDYTEEHGVQMTTVARQCGYSKSVISEWLSGKYIGSVDKVTHAVNDWMERDARRSDKRRPKNYITTLLAEAIRSYAIMADKGCMMAAIVAPSGSGKTLVLKTLTEEMRGIYVYCHRHLTPREFLMTIALLLGRRTREGSKAELHRFIVESLAGTNRILFLDEAHQLGSTIGCVRAIHDEARVPIVMAGTLEILQFVNDRSDGRGQFSSRTLSFNAMKQAINAESPDGDGEPRKNLFTLEEVKAFFDSRKIRLNKDALQMMWLLACLPNWGCLRLIESACNVIFDVEPDLEIITRPHVVMALNMIHGGNASHLERLTRQHLEISRSLKVA